MKKRLSDKLVFILIILCATALTINLKSKDRNGSEHFSGELSEQSKDKNNSGLGYGVVADSEIAVEVGMQIMEQGGNAVDAAIGVSYALGVTAPFSSGIGGGGAMLVYSPNEIAPISYDYTGVAPNNSKYNIAVPGFVKGMEEVHKDFGNISMDKILDPSIKIANQGFEVTPLLSNIIKKSEYKIDKDVMTNFFSENEPIKLGEVLKQPNLAKTLERIKNDGADVFYVGEVANSIANADIGITMDDLARYEVRKKEAVKGVFNGYEVYSSAPPLGGITLIQTLSLTDSLNLDEYEFGSLEYMSLLSDIFKLTYNDRLLNVCDPDFYDINSQELLSKSYSDKLTMEIGGNEKLSEQLKIETTNDEDGLENTTHIVTYDKNGMMVSVTNTLTNWFGSGKNIDGFYLNNHMENFSINSHSLNKVEPEKRPRSNISPTILVNKDKFVMGIGTPGGRRIPMMMTEVLMRFMKDNMPLQQAVAAPRFYTNKKQIYIENLNIGNGIKNNDKIKNYSVIKNGYPLSYGSVNTILVDYYNNEIIGGADHRREAKFSSVKLDKTE